MKSSDNYIIPAKQGIVNYSHAVVHPVIHPENLVEIKSRALSFMEERTNIQLQHIQQQAEWLAEQAHAIKKRIEISNMIYSAKMTFEPVIGNTYYLYEQGGEYELMMIGSNPLGHKRNSVLFINRVTLLSDYTWEVVY